MAEICIALYKGRDLVCLKHCDDVGAVLLFLNGYDEEAWDDLSIDGKGDSKFESEKGECPRCGGVVSSDESESEVLYLLWSCEQRVFSKCGREFEMDCDEHDTCEFRQRLRNEIRRIENDGCDV